MSNTIQTADLAWQCIDGIEIPISKQFGDVYFSKDNGLLETRHVFLNGNDLPERLQQLQDFDYFCIGETGFGTGLNILALWQLWQKVRPSNHSHLHVISVEKFPLTKTDLIRALHAWPELKLLTDQLIQQYPLPLAGCHRLSFPNERFSIDLWLGDAHDVFPNIAKTHPVNAWFLDGFAPSCNPDMWEEQVLKHLVRLSNVGTTFSSFSVAGVLKRGLQQHGLSISRPRGFKHKREMLKAVWAAETHETCQSIETNKNQKKIRHIAIIGAGIAGLTTAWACAKRGHQVTIFEQSTALSGASGNPLALLNPKLCAIEQTSEHLMTLAWQYAITHYAQFSAFQKIQVHQLALKNPEDLIALSEQYPSDILHMDEPEQGLLQSTYLSLNLCHAGVISPQKLCLEILQNPSIQVRHTKVIKLEQHAHVHLNDAEHQCHNFDHVVVCAAYDSAALFTTYPTLKPTRGQISWLKNTETPLQAQHAYSYGGYCMQLNQEQLILGASFHPNCTDTHVSDEDHRHNFNLLHSAFPNYASTLAPIQEWQGRASIRAQSLDYFPLVGQVDLNTEIYTLAGLGSKGFLFAPLCSEVLVAQMLNEICPVSETLMQKLSPQRFIKKVKPKKPYFKPQNT